ncbi:tetratricopeptide repeat protein [Geobacter pickeringii]|uniref:Tetratricopeptide repeat-like domain-containing protein n=1 Tax=Geobacter pickeringii TaxID=345632 RepID=A0A0B5BID3_9BACT|nr:hypothetical protein [Geobacter pickeringii]AJE04270.1 hypothetical protein GPICK_13755 [Geobacter pickeringii]
MGKPIKTPQRQSAGRRKLFLTIAGILIAATAILTAITWPYNPIGRGIYRLLGKELPPTRSEELANIKRFLSARRKLDKKDYAAAFNELEYLRTRAGTSFTFFKEVYLYLGYIYEIRGDIAGEEQLYRELAGKDRVFARFMEGLYNFHHNHPTEARKALDEAIALDNRLNRLGKYRPTALKALERIDKDASRPDGRKP